MSRIQCDLVLLTWDHLEETRPCVESLLATVDVPSRLLIVDNGSVSPAKEFVDSVKPAGQILEVRVLRNATNEGYPRGMNRGLRESTAPYVCLLNNDLLFAPGWLSELLRVAASDPAIGIVNPSSDTLGQVLPAGQSPADYGATLRPLAGQWVEMGAAVGFCMLIRREVAARVGLMGDQFGMGYFEDTDYCLRARQAGFRCVRAQGAFVHHKENRSFKDTWGSQRARQRHFDESARVFAAKWGPLERVACVASAPGAWVAPMVLAAANRDHRVTVFYPAGRVPRLPEHANIALTAVKAAGFRWRLLWRLTTKKKKFHRIVVDDARLAVGLRALRWWHRGRVEAPASPVAADAPKAAALLAH